MVAARASLRKLRADVWIAVPLTSVFGVCGMSEVCAFAACAVYMVCVGAPVRGSRGDQDSVSMFFCGSAWGESHKGLKWRETCISNRVGA